MLSRVGDGSDQDDAFRQAVLRRWPAFDTLVLRRGDWLGQVDTPIHEVPEIGCIRWFELSITATGTVAHCCMDGEAKWPLGDVSSQHVLEIYNQPAFRALRVSAASRREAEPCDGCTFL
ncbi:MAG: SPASM domain-containing protein [Myxococcota bacterium]